MDSNSVFPLNFVITPGASAPRRATKGAAGFDCTALTREFLTCVNGELVPVKPPQTKQFDIVKYSTGLSFEIPQGYVILTFARSSIAKMPLMLANSTGVIDSDFRGEITFMFRIFNPQNIANTSYQVGDRIGQLVVLKLGELAPVEVSELAKSARGSGMFGSTGQR